MHDATAPKVCERTLQRAVPRALKFLLAMKVHPYLFAKLRVGSTREVHQEGWQMLTNAADIGEEAVEDAIDNHVQKAQIERGSAAPTVWVRSRGSLRSCGRCGASTPSG
jgi:hypothetical protein